MTTTDAIESGCQRVYGRSAADCSDDEVRMLGQRLDEVMIRQRQELDQIQASNRDRWERIGRQFGWLS